MVSAEIPTLAIRRSREATARSSLSWLFLNRREEALGSFLKLVDFFWSNFENEPFVHSLLPFLALSLIGLDFVLTTLTDTDERM